MIHQTSQNEYSFDMRDLVDSDHCGLQCELHNRWQEQKGENSKEKKKIVSFSQVGKMKDDSYWEEIQQVSDDKMKATIEMMNSKEDIEGKWNALKE